MKIGVVVPYWTPGQKEKELLERCLKSIDPRFLVFPIEDSEHEGVSIARNQGIEAALRKKVDYITFLDADDTMNPDAWEQIKGAIAEEPGELLIQMNHLRRKGEMTYNRFFNRRGTYYPDRLPSLWVVVWNKVFKAELIRDIRFIPKLQHGEDELFVLECLAKSRRIYCSEKIGMTHHFDNEVSLSKIVKPEDLVREQHTLLFFLQDHEGDFEICEAVRNRQMELWNNRTYKAVFTGKE